IFIFFRTVVHDHDGFLGSLTGDRVEGTLVGSLTASLSAITAGAAILRVHRRAAGPSGDARHVACNSAKRRKPNSFHLRQSVSCFSSMVKIAPSLTSISSTMHMRP